MIYTLTLNPALDRSVEIENFAVGKLNRILSTRDFPGGKGINVSKIIKELGGSSIAMGIIGGATGNYIRQSLEEAGIQTDFVTSDSETRINLKISDPIRHTTTDINAPGAPVSPEVCETLIKRLLNRVQPGDTVAVSGRAHGCDIKALICRIRASGARVFLDTEGDALRSGISAAPALIKPNAQELGALLGCRIASPWDAVPGAKSIIEKSGVEIALISCGSGGAVCVSHDQCLISRGVKVQEICTTGAGDTMLGAFTYALACGSALKDAFALSIAAGAAAVTMPGSECPGADLIYKLLRQVKTEQL